MKKTPTDTQAWHASTWSTASCGSAVETSPIELAALSDHLRCCASGRGALFRIASFVEAVDRVAGPRLVTIIALFTCLSVLASLIL